MDINKLNDETNQEGDGKCSDASHANDHGAADPTGCRHPPIRLLLRGDQNDRCTPSLTPARRQRSGMPASAWSLSTSTKPVPLRITLSPSFSFGSATSRSP